MATFEGNDITGECAEHLIAPCLLTAVAFSPLLPVTIARSAVHFDLYS